MGQMTVEQWYGTIKTGLTKKLTENKEALPAGFNQQRFILNCITVIQDMMKDDKKKAQLEKINPGDHPGLLSESSVPGTGLLQRRVLRHPVWRKPQLSDRL